jgi:hypothetical protein
MPRIWDRARRNGRVEAASQNNFGPQIFVDKSTAATDFLLPIQMPSLCIR